jgi:hypothetical protein
MRVLISHNFSPSAHRYWIVDRSCGLAVDCGNRGAAVLIVDTASGKRSASATFISLFSALAIQIKLLEAEAVAAASATKSERFFFKSLEKASKRFG